ncbi:uncharacterized protein TNCV_4129331 [Trichonephila clavipes]|nr:uncharacterized protein TNCV_4129331 [Trichonephila clavipes]
MALAAAETLSFNNGNPNVHVAIDGMGQKRGHTSLNGVVTAVSVDTEKVVDAEILSRNAHVILKATYIVMSFRQITLEIVGEWKLKVHFVSSIAQRALKLKLKGKTLEDKKSLGGRNRLTDAEIDKLQRYYDLNPQHGLCPLGDDSWCGYNRSKLKGLINKLKVLDLLNIQPGFYTCRALQEADHARIRKAETAISRRTKDARIKNRQLKCRQEDDLADNTSNPSYGPGLYKWSIFQKCSLRLIIINIAEIGTDDARIRKAENAISQRTKVARIKNRQLKCRQKDDLADDPSNPSYGSGMY